MKPITHGKPSSYSSRNCRCDKCRVAWNAYCAERKRRRHAEHVYDPEATHGTESSYQAGCKCRLCLDGHNVYIKHLHKNAKLPVVSEMREEQGGLCAVCRLPSARLVIDHVHATGEIRGLLCDRCNTGIGKLGDTYEGVMAAAEYLKNYPRK